MSETWTISAGDRSYGPYTIAQMRSFAAEGRLAPHSRVMRNGESDFHLASEDILLAPLFSSTHNFTGIDRTMSHAEQPSQRFGRRDNAGEANEMAHYVIVADMKSRSVAGLEEEIFTMGSACSLMPQLWLLTCPLGINAVRNTLVQKLGKLDMLFVVDATHDKAAWFNFGPESDARIRKLWTRIGEPQKAAS